MEPRTTQPYRSQSPAAPPVVVDVRHLSLLWSPVALLFPLLLVQLSHRVTVHCERAFDGGGYCVSRDDTLTRRGVEAPVALSEVDGIGVVGEDDATVVAFTRGETQIALSSREEAASRAEKQEVVNAVGHFMQDPRERSVDAAYGSLWSQYFSPLTTSISLGIAAFVFLLLVRVRVIVDPAAKVVRVQRWPRLFDSREQRFPLDEVAGATVEEFTGGDSGSTYRVALLLADGCRVALTRGFSSGRRRKALLAERLERAIRGHEAAR